MQNEIITLKIKQICKERHIPVSILLQECGLSKSFIYDLEKRNSSPSCDKISKIADYLNVSVDYLLGITSSNDAPIADKNSDFYRLLLSDKGLTIIRQQLSKYIDNYGHERLGDDIGVSYADIKTFLTTDLTVGNLCTQKLDTILIALETNIYDILEGYFVDDAMKSYLTLDAEDKAEIKGTINQMLKAEKYTEEDAPEKKVSLADMGTIAATSGKSNKPKTKSAKIIK